MPSTPAFINEHLADARVASSKLGIPVSVILAQWINETGSGGSPAFVGGHNYAGVSYLDQPEAQVGASLGQYSPILSYPTEAAGLAGYIARWLEPVYGPTRQIWTQTSDPITVARSIEQSPWAAGHYGGNGLENLIGQYNLTAYDDPSIQAAPSSGTDTSGTSSSTTSGGTSAQLTGFSLNPLDWIGGIFSGAKADVLKVVLTGTFVTAGLVLIVGGFWRAASPRVEAATQRAAPLAAAAAL